MKRLTNGELWTIEREIDQLNETVDLCGDNDDDVLEACAARLDVLINILETSVRLSRIAESGLRVVS